MSEHERSQPKHEHPDAGVGAHAHHHEAWVSRVVRSVFSPHDHGHLDHDTSREGMRALAVSLVGLGVTAALQVVVLAISGSVALLADTVHNFTDALTAVPLGIAFWLGRRRPTSRYPYGYGRAEDLAGMFIVLAIALSALVAFWQAAERLVSPRPIDNVWWVFAAGLVGFLGNELVAVYRIGVGRRIGSAALAADGLHARADGLTSLAVVGGALGAAAGWELADPLVGLLISIGILLVLGHAARDIGRRVMDGVEPALAERVHAVLASVEGVEAVEAVRMRWVGHDLLSEVEVVSDCDLSLAQAHAIAEQAQHRLLHEIPRLVRVSVHSNPCDHDGQDHHGSTAHHFASLPLGHRR